MSFEHGSCFRRKCISQHDLNSDQNPGWLDYIGDEILTNFCGDYFINHDIRIPIKPPYMVHVTSIGFMKTEDVFTCVVHL